MLDLISNGASGLPEFGCKPAHLSCSNPRVLLDFVAS